jgi:hypothetical protein
VATGGRVRRAVVAPRLPFVRWGWVVVSSDQRFVDAKLIVTKLYATRVLLARGLTFKQ